ncbi:nitroimidazol reductase NimA-like FMN-containing flavoprotein (pyridoxamine 5'-phosphate oxidase superfamily) [Nocardiopsis terrae]|uniref:Nitroimidazol reductase NimA-like FMN-containing flavoprotein (Pyridoxamine 5'-phosphate oxidase superfamily) n=1 Tax=Nocardiopsis terrae TaxID=372655 RepID=A0ABR9HCW8_9ACTN|nr:pyridoxamine 5'-phosphate oxidase family protein [Nocardiopsis terrae]MBE1456871.1 nitroimidazol reductase NimA-like FMN-containing flavoprotein (pyridoxamine 5'-phosphate oxidase superfamily) [Nocardiopsis terrae]
MGRESGVGHGGSDLGRRAAARREELGLTREEVADSAGMDPGYVAYLEEHAPRMPRESLYRLARALNTSQDYLLGTDTDLPPGAATTAAPLPETHALSPDRCMELIGPGGVGRIGFVPEGESAPTILPVNYLVRDGAVVFRTGDHGVIAEYLPGDAAFEVDRVDGATSEGWSVLLVGRAAAVTDEAEAAALRAGARVRPWAGGDRDLFVRVTPDRVSGREVSGRTSG